MKKYLPIAAIVVGIVAVLVMVGSAYYKTKFPYGRSHCCISGMMFALEQYSVENAGLYPTGESTPEASLGLLCRSNYVDAYTIRGMIVPEDTVRKTLEGGGLLGPDTCGWYYTDGLTRADDTRIALLYCKQPLGHNGQRTKDGGRQVAFVGGSIEWISARKWSSFLQEQEELLSKRSDRAKSGSPLVRARIQIPDGRETESVDGAYEIYEESTGPDSSGSGTQSGNRLDRDTLVWFHPPLANGSVTRTVSFSNMVSAPVTVTFVGGVPDKTNVIFKMTLR